MIPNNPDNRLRNLHHALQLNSDQQPEMRVGARITNMDPIPVSLGTETVTITGDVIIPTVLDVQNATDTKLQVDGVLGVNILDGAINSAFGRLRTANTRLLGEFRNMYGTTGGAEIVTKFESGGSQTVNLAQTHTLINVTDQSGSRAIRQSRRYHPYIPGTTNLAFVSFTFGVAKDNLQQMVGLFDDENGIFLRLDGGQVQMVIRQGGTDTQVVNQADWNTDKLDGTGPSTLTIDWTKSQIFFCDYQWLGVGRVRVGMNLNGRLIICHAFNHANQIQTPYMFQPSLPVRWEIVNTAATASESSMMTICFAVYCEGSDNETGFENSASTGVTRITLAAAPNNVKGLLAVRLRNSVNGQPMRAYARLKDWQVVTSFTARVRVMMLQSKAEITLANGDVVQDANWDQASPTGWCEYLTDFRLASPTLPSNTVVLFDGYVEGGSNRGNASLFQIDNRSACIYQNYDSTDSMIIAIVADRIPNDNAAMLASLNWIEVK
jgi:hypothetical protein